MDKKTIERSSKYIMNTYKRFPVIFSKGRGMHIWNDEDKIYLDFLAGIAVNVLGHCHHKVVVAIQKQSQRLIHTSNLYYNKRQAKLASLLINNSFADKVFFSNSGAEANEAAIKLARKYNNDINAKNNRTEILTAYNSFHGRTYAALTATGQAKMQKGFEPLMPDFKYFEYNDIKSLQHATSDRTCAVMLEPIQGEGGIKVPSKEYFKKVRQHCDKHNILLILDEVQTGIGRTGKFFAYEHFDIKPDILTLAKALGGGMPIGATLATQEIAESFNPGSHGSTFGGNPIACSAAIATIETVLEDGIMLSECKRLGNYFMKRLLEIKQKYPDIIVDVRGMGLMIGMELNRECGEVVDACFESGVLINCAGSNTLRFCPPLIVTVKDIDKLINVLSKALEGML